ncbi:PadR family transcriptional regulator [Oceanobacillus piezotolerans]|uniref:PadR family transcriptional regulator n=1 Tax=Oceanobacillus piezotolerans TaxID=2448030 RepID=A0A498D6T6_9BACI|nr:PadR family transcriptional regulator [Oceanobacillus piezotolerans]RLL43724.1 PadR family transcriptional regulator [Oceanobacillus piezotolerans]
MKTNHTKFVIMGILTTNCRSGYQIKQFIDQSLNHFWKLSYGQIYPTLKQIVEEGLATVQYASQEDKPDKKEYFLTEKGKEAFYAWLEKPLEEIPVEKNNVLLKIFFSRHQSKAKTIEHLSYYKEKLQERYVTYESIEWMISSGLSELPDAQYWLFTLDYGKRVTKAAMEWCEATANKLKE